MYPKVLQKADIPINQPGTCLTENFICFGNADISIDHGDSGGPLMIKRNGNLYQIGISSGSGGVGKPFFKNQIINDNCHNFRLGYPNFGLLWMA